MKKATTPRQTYRPHEHLRRRDDFRRVFDQRRSVSDACLIVYGHPNGLDYLRLGLSVSRRLGNAVVRNKIRRRCREAFRLTRDQMPVGLDLVLVPRGGRVPSLEELKASLPRLVHALAKKWSVS